MSQAARRTLFIATILVGSFLLFLVQPLVARLALPLLGGAPNVWNSAMLVYQALLLGGYAYAHFLSRWPVRRQAIVHLSLMALAALTLPLSLAQLPPPEPGMEALWVPALLALTVGPVFFLVSAQAPLMQRWFAAEEGAGDPYWLYAASNIGSLAGLLSYPLLFEPFLSLSQQAGWWSGLYAVLLMLVGAAAAARWQAGGGALPRTDAATPDRPIGAKRIMLWLALAAVPSGLMLSTTTHLTTDIFAMPLLWVIPLGLYLLSFVPAFSERRGAAHLVSQIAPPVLLLAGGLAMASRGHVDMTNALAALAMLFVVAAALHSRLYEARPDPARLTLFYLVMSAGGVLGGLFTALVAPLVFDWVWEHPLLVLAAAALLPDCTYLHWMRRLGISAGQQLVITGLLLVVAAVLADVLLDYLYADAGWIVAGLTLAVAACGLLVFARRWAFVLVLVLLMLARGGIDTIETSWESARSRSYFGVYTVEDWPSEKMRMLAHGTTLHGKQSLDPAKRLVPTSYYGPGSGVGLVLSRAQALYGRQAHVGVVGLGAGTLACYRQPGERFEFYEIDPAVLAYSRDRTFTYLPDCAPGSPVHIGDARLELAKAPAGSFDILVIDAFSSDAIPLHLLTREALDIYRRALAPDGIILFHISNRYINLRPVLAAAARDRRWRAIIRDNRPDGSDGETPSHWVATGPDAQVIAQLAKSDRRYPWEELPAPARSAWTDDHASILPFIRWQNMLSTMR